MTIRSYRSLSRYVQIVSNTNCICYIKKFTVNLSKLGYFALFRAKTKYIISLISHTFTSIERSIIKKQLIFWMLLCPLFSLFCKSRPRSVYNINSFFQISFLSILKFTCDYRCCKNKLSNDCNWKAKPYRVSSRHPFCLREQTIWLSQSEVVLLSNSRKYSRIRLTMTSRMVDPCTFHRLE